MIRIKKNDKITKEGEIQKFIEKMSSWPRHRDKNVFFF